jgi:hypothetical protein
VPPDRKTPIGDFGSPPKPGLKEPVSLVMTGRFCAAHAIRACPQSCLTRWARRLFLSVVVGVASSGRPDAPASRTRVACDPDRYTVIHRRFADFPPLISAQGAPQDSHSVAIAAMREFMKRMRTQLESAAYPPNVLRRYAAITRRDNAARVPYLFLNRTGEVISAY